MQAVFVNKELHFIGKRFLLFPFSAQEVKGAGDGEAISSGTVAKHEAIEAPAENDTKQHAEADTEHNAVKEREHKSKLCVADPWIKAPLPRMMASAGNIQRMAATKVSAISCTKMSSENRRKSALPKHRYTIKIATVKMIE